MKIRIHPYLLIPSIMFVTLLAGPTASAQNQYSASDTRTLAAATPIATVHVPHPFWVEGARLPAGDYTLSRVAETIVLLRNTKAAGVEVEAFLVPSEDSAPAREPRLVFVVHEGRHYLTELWDRGGRMTVTSQLYPMWTSSDTLSQVPIVDGAAK
jgi:hypothetical protein